MVYSGQVKYEKNTLSLINHIKFLIYHYLTTFTVCMMLASSQSDV